MAHMPGGSDGGGLQGECGTFIHNRLIPTPIRTSPPWWWLSHRRRPLWCRLRHPFRPRTKTRPPRCSQPRSFGTTASQPMAITRMWRHVPLDGRLFPPHHQEFRNESTDTSRFAPHIWLGLPGWLERLRFGAPRPSRRGDANARQTAGAFCGRRPVLQELCATVAWPRYPGGRSRWLGRGRHLDWCGGWCGDEWAPLQQYRCRCCNRLDDGYDDWCWQ